MLNILMISIIWVFIIDLSGAIPKLNKTVGKWLFKGIKTEIELPVISCSLCSTFWTGLLYLLISGQFILYYIAYVCFISFMTPVIKDLLITIKEKICGFINNI